MLSQHDFLKYKSCHEQLGLEDRLLDTAEKQEGD
jgi:hypothetical protein